MAVPIIKPCPFCGDTPNYDDPDFIYPANRNGTAWSANCCRGGTGCGCRLYGNGMADVLARWNKRHMEGRENG